MSVAFQSGRPDEELRLQSGITHAVTPRHTAGKTASRHRARTALDRDQRFHALNAKKRKTGRRTMANMRLEIWLSHCGISALS